MSNCGKTVYEIYSMQKSKSMKKVAAETGLSVQRVSQIIKRWGLSSNIKTLLDVLVEKFDLEDFDHGQMAALNYLQKYVNDVEREDD